MKAPATDMDGTAPPSDGCEVCYQAFDVSLPDTDAHWYWCCGCDAVCCFDCKNMDRVGNDRCPDCDAHHRATGQ